MDRKTRRKQYYQSHDRKKRKYDMQVGLKGFLCSCNTNEKACVAEASNILNNYAEILYNTPQEDEENIASDIEDDLTNEIERLRSEKVKRFKSIDSGAKNLVFISTTLDDPVKICSAIIEDTVKNNLRQTRHLIRLIPVENVTKAHLSDIKAAMLVLVEKYFTNEYKTFSIAVNRRNNNHLLKSDVLEIIAEIIGEKYPDYRVDIKNSDITIVVEIIRNYAHLAIIPYYNKHKRHNLHVLCSQNEEDKGEVASNNEGKNLKDEHDKKDLKGELDNEDKKDAKKKQDNNDKKDSMEEKENDDKEDPKKEQDNQDKKD